MDHANFIGLVVAAAAGRVNAPRGVSIKVDEPRERAVAMLTEAFGQPCSTFGGGPRWVRSDGTLVRFVQRFDAAPARRSIKRHVRVYGPRSIQSSVIEMTTHAVLIERLPDYGYALPICDARRTNDGVFTFTLHGGFDLAASVVDHYAGRRGTPSPSVIVLPTQDDPDHTTIRVSKWSL